MISPPPRSFVAASVPTADRAPAEVDGFLGGGDVHVRAAPGEGHATVAYHQGVDDRIRRVQRVDAAVNQPHAQPAARQLATTLRIRRSPTSSPKLRIDSGWNCTAASGSTTCSTAMITPSSAAAVTRSDAGSLSGSANSE